MTIGMLLNLISVQNIASAYKNIQGALSAGPDEISWVLSSFLIAEVIMLPLSGWLMRALSTRIFFTICAVGFSFMSILCGFAWNIESMIVFRVFQGFFGGGMMPAMFAVLFTLYPKKEQETNYGEWFWQHSSSTRPRYPYGFVGWYLFQSGRMCHPTPMEHTPETWSPVAALAAGTAPHLMGDDPPHSLLHVLMKPIITPQATGLSTIHWSPQMYPQPVVSDAEEPPPPLLLSFPELLGHGVQKAHENESNEVTFTITRQASGQGITPLRITCPMEEAVCFYFFLMGDFPVSYQGIITDIATPIRSGWGTLRDYSFTSSPQTSDTLSALPPYRKTYYLQNTTSVATPRHIDFYACAFVMRLYQSGDPISQEGRHALPAHSIITPSTPIATPWPGLRGTSPTEKAMWGANPFSSYDRYDPFFASSDDGHWYQYSPKSELVEKSPDMSRPWWTIPVEKPLSGWNKTDWLQDFYQASHRLPIGYWDSLNTVTASQKYVMVDDNKIYLDEWYAVLDGWDLYQTSTVPSWVGTLLGEVGLELTEVLAHMAFYRQGWYPLTFAGNRQLSPSQLFQLLQKCCEAKIAQPSWSGKTWKSKSTMSMFYPSSTQSHFIYPYGETAISQSRLDFTPSVMASDINLQRSVTAPSTETPDTPVVLRNPYRSFPSST